MFTASEIRALRTLVRIWTIDRFVLIGASAMRVLMGDRSRETHDLDSILAVSLAQYPAGLEAEPGWSRHPKREHTWLGPGDVSVDVYPSSATDEQPDVLTWPESGFQMSLSGCRLALEHAVTVEVAPDLSVRVAPLEVVALLKMVAFLDRPFERERDLADIAVILDEYVDAADDRRYGDKVLDLGLRFEEVSPFLLGTRLGEIANQPEREVIDRFIQLLEEPDESPTQARMLSLAPPSWQKNPEELQIRLVALERGLRSGTVPH